MFGFLSKKKQEKWISPNFNERKPLIGMEKPPSMLIFHYTGMKRAVEALERLCDPKNEVSAHIVIEENGDIHQLVDYDKRAWHAGVSYWDGMTDLNSASIGIEIVNPGHEWGYVDFSEEQIFSAIDLSKKLISQFDIHPAHILGHSDISPDRKTDPGELFPWQDFATQGIGLWPRPVEQDFQSAQDIMLDKDRIKQTFGSFGYNTNHNIDLVVRAFHRHYYANKFFDDSDPSEPDVATIARLLSLIRQKHEAH